MGRIDFSLPQKMGAGAFIIIFIKLFLRFLGPVASYAVVKILDYSSDAKFSVLNLIFLCIVVCTGFALLGAAISYFPKRFYVKNGNLIFIHGLINHEETFVPLERVHSLRTRKGLMYRLLGVRGIVFDTLATRKEEIELILDDAEWQQLLARIENEDAAAIPQPEAVAETQSPMVRYPNINLLLAALCQNHFKGMAIFGSILGVIIGNLEDISETATATFLEGLESYVQNMLTTPAGIFYLSLEVYVIALLVWLGRVLLRYYNMTMRYDSNMLTFTFGLFTRVTSRFYHDKICTLRIKRNFLEHKFGFCTLMLRQALNASAKKEEDNLKLYGTDSSRFFLDWWLGEDYAEAEEIMSGRSGKGIVFHSMWPGLLLAVAVSVALIYYHLLSWLVLPFVFVIVLLIRGIYTMRHSKIVLKSSYLVVHAGAFAEIENYIKYSNVEVIRIRRTPLTKLFHRVALELATSGTTLVVRSLKEEEARILFELCLLK